MSDTVFVAGLVVHAYHGVLEHEGRVGQSFALDLALDLDLAAASSSDRLADTIGYEKVVDVACRAFQAERFRLIEAAAGAVATALLDGFPRVRQVRVTVKKPHAPIAAVFDNVGVTIVRARHG